MKLKFVILFLVYLTLASKILAANSGAEQLKNTTWDYQLIFHPSQIPKPASSGGDVTIKAVYSPSVVYFNDEYLMIFGISIYCQNGNVARDSIAIAKSQDGLTWQFGSYLLEPTTTACSSPFQSWPDNFTFQMNDPKAIVLGDQIVVFYTNVVWPNDNYGNIGIIHLNKNLSITYRNDIYLKGTNIIGGPGFSRPDLEQISENSYKLWLDSGGRVGSIPVTNYTQLDSNLVKNEQLSGIDINLPHLSKTEDIMLINSSVISAIDRPDDQSSWSSPWSLTRLSGQSWDTWYQGSPDLYLDKNKCQIKLYYAGAVNAGNNTYESLSIGVATPNNKTFNFSTCTNKVQIGDLNNDGVVDVYDYSILKNEYGLTTNLKADLNHDNITDIFDYNIMIANF